MARKTTITKLPTIVVTLSDGRLIRTEVEGIQSVDARDSTDILNSEELQSVVSRNEDCVRCAAHKTARIAMNDDNAEPAETMVSGACFGGTAALEWLVETCSVSYVEEYRLA